MALLFDNVKEISHHSPIANEQLPVAKREHPGSQCEKEIPPGRPANPRFGRSRFIALGDIFPSAKNNCPFAIY